MGNSNKKNNFKDNANEKTDELLKEKKMLEKTILLDEISSRGNVNKKKDKKKNNEETKIKFELNIFVCTDEPIDDRILNSISQHNSEVFKWNVSVLEEFSEQNSKTLLSICEQDFKKKSFKNVLIIPIQSISSLKETLEQKGKDIFLPFNELTEEQQPFFLIIDDEGNDFTEYKSEINLKYSVKDEKKVDYGTFNDEIIQRVIQYRRKNYDYQLKLSFVLLEQEKIKILKDYLIKLKNNKDYFEIYINDELFYQFLFGSENFDILKSSDFEDKLIAEIISKNILHISIILFNINNIEFIEYYEIFEVKKVEFYSYEFKNQELNNILRQKKYEYLDKRNFNVIRFKQSPKNILLKYTGYYNQLGDILFCDHINFYPAKINIAIGGYIGSGKSTLINTIFEEKRCLEGQGSSITNYISQFSLKDYPINFYDFPGFRAKQNGKDNTFLFIEEIKSKISDLKKMNEIIHCFLFCIKFDERIFDENDEDMKEVFDAIAKLKIRTFFIITGSEKEETRQFKNFKKIIINNLTKIKEKYKEEGDKIFGKDLDKNIIPILSRDKTFHGFKAKAFGLDNLFRTLYQYFLPKKINFQKEVFFNEEQLKAFIQSNELLKIFESKKKLSKDFRDKIESQLDKLLMKFFLKAPKYIYSFSEESIKEIINEFVDQIFYLSNYYLNQKSKVEKLQALNRLYDIKNSMNKELFQEIEEEQFQSKAYEKIKNNIPLAVKIIFPFLSPIYYIIGTPIIKIFSGKIINFLLEQMEMDDMIYLVYFEELISNLNKGIDDLDDIRKHFQDIYNSDKFESELIRILENGNDEVSSNDLNELKNICNELLKYYKNPIVDLKLEVLFNALKNSCSSKENNLGMKNCKKLDNIFSIIKNICKVDEGKND